MKLRGKRTFGLMRLVKHIASLSTIIMKKSNHFIGWKMSMLLLGAMLFLSSPIMAQRTCGTVQTSTSSFANPNYGPTYEGRNSWSQTQAIKHRRASYYYKNGLFYQRYRHGYHVVQPPIGILVDKKPHRARKVKHRGWIYYKSGRYWYQKRGVRTYELVRNPMR